MRIKVMASYCPTLRLKGSFAKGHNAILAAVKDKAAKAFECEERIVPIFETYRYKFDMNIDEWGKENYLDFEEVKRIWYEGGVEMPNHIMTSISTFYFPQTNLWEWTFSLFLYPINDLRTIALIARENDT